VAYAILHEEPAQLDQQLPDRPPALDSVLAKALTKEPSRRWQKAEELIEGLETVSGVRAAVAPAPKRSVRRVAAVATLIGLAVVATGFWIWNARRSAGGRAAAVTSTATPTPASRKLDPEQVAVVPFENHTGDPSLDAMGQLAANRITDDLTQIHIRVLSQQALAESAASLRSAATPDAGFAYALAEATGTGLVVTGEYYVSGSKLTVKANVADVATRKIVAVLDPAEASRADPNESIAITGRLLRDALAVRLLGPEAARRLVASFQTRPPSFEAYSEMILSVEADEKVDYRKALGHAKKAVELDPDFVAAHLMIVDRHMYLNEFREAKQAWALADERRALLSRAGRFYLDSGRNYLYGRWEDELALERERVRAMPGDLEEATYQLMNALVMTGRARETVKLITAHDAWKGRPPGSRIHALRSLARAYAVLGNHNLELAAARTCRAEYPAADTCRLMELWALAALGSLDELEKASDEALNEPGAQADAASLTSHVAVLRAHGNREAARALANRILLRIRDLPPDEQVKVRASKARLLLETNRPGDAVSIYKELAAEKAGTPWEKMRLGDLGVAAAAAGDRARARKISNDLMRLRNEEDLGYVYFERARISARLGDKEESVELLKKAFADGWTAWLSFYQLTLTEDYAFDSMRGYPPFDEYLKSKD